MKTHSEAFKNGINKLGRQIKSRITFTLNSELVELGNSELNSITPSYETTLLKSVMKYIEVDSNVEIPVGTVFKYELGLKIGNSYEYLNYGNYVVKEVEIKEDTNSYLIKAYDKMLYSMKEYEPFVEEYPITIRDYITELATKIGLTFANEEDEFVNYDKEIQNELYVSEDGNSLGYTFRDVLDQLSEVTASNIVINEDDELELRYITAEVTPFTPSKNIVDTQGFQKGYINTSGAFVSDNKTALLNQKIPVEAGETYCFSTNANVDNMVISMFGSSDNFLRRQKVSNTNKLTQTMANDVVYVRYAVNYNNSATMTQAIIDSLEIMGEEGSNRTTPYEPYIEPPVIDEIDETYLKNINVKFGKTFGPVNTITLTRAGGSDSIYNEDAESVAQYGRCEIIISENQIMNFNDRDTYIPAILTQLDGLEFSICDFDSTGVCYYEIGDKFNVSVGEETYNCLMLNDTIEITQGLQESIYVDEPEETNTDYTKSDKTDNKINQTYIIANKQEGKIEALTSRVTTTEDSLRNTYTIDQVNTLIQTAETGITNTFSEAGGNNIFRNTGLFFENNNNDSATNPYEFWNGKVVRGSEDKASNQNCLILQNDTLYQEQTIPNGTYTISFKYKKLIALSTVKVVINNNEYTLTETTDTNFTQTIEVNSRHINVQFICDINNGCEVYDLMVNAGGVALAYSQNQNETTTDTVNISKGIEITSSETNTKFRADSDGVRIYNVNSSSTDPVTKFTDRGMETDQAVIETKAEIVKTLWQDVNNHTWITRL